MDLSSWIAADPHRTIVIGEFRQMAPSPKPRTMSPPANRLILFQPVPERLREVLPLTEGARHWHRWAHTLCFVPPVGT